MAMTATMAGKASRTKAPALRETSSRPPLYPETRPRVPPTSHADGHRAEADDQGDPRPEDEAAQQVATEVVGSQEVVEARARR